MSKLAREIIVEEQQHRRALHESGKPQWSGALQDALAWVGIARTRAEDELRKIRLEYSERLGAWYPKSEPNPDSPPQRDHVHNLIAIFTLIGGLFAALLEALLAGFLSIRFFELPFWAALILGVGITIFFAGLVMACIAALILARYPDRSRATSRPLILILSLALPLGLVLMTVFFLTRGIQTPFLISLFGWDTALLAIDLPIVAGVLLTLRGLFNWSGEYEDSYHDLLTAKSRVEALFAYCERELGEMKPTTPEPRPPVAQRPGDGIGETPKPEVPKPPPTNGGTIFPILLAIALAAASYAHSARAAVAASPPVSAELWLDDTSSVDNIDRAQAIDRLFVLLPKLSKKHGVQRWLLYGFGDNSWREYPFFVSDLPRLKPPHCVPKIADDPLFRQHNDHIREQNKKDCTELWGRAVADLDRATASAFQDLKSAVKNHRGVNAGCTSIGDLLIRLSGFSAARYSLVVTDGIETCRSHGLPSIVAPPKSNHIVFVLTESGATNPTRSAKGAAPSPAELYLQRQSALTTAAPWLVVLSPSSMDERILDTVSPPWPAIVAQHASFAAGGRGSNGSLHASR